MLSVAKLATFWNIPVISHWSIGDELSNAEVYKTLGRVAPTLTQLGHSILAVMLNYKWTQIALIGDTSVYSVLTLNAIQNYVTLEPTTNILKRFTVDPTKTVTSFFSYQGDMKSVLEIANQTARGEPDSSLHTR
jgi:Receptor family ligand binding region